MKLLKAIWHYIQFKMGYVGLPLTWVRHDKQKHALGGMWFGAAGFILSQTIITNYWLSALIGVTVAYAVGILKETFDKVFDWHDVLATVLGGAFINIVLLLIWQK